MNRTPIPQLMTFSSGMLTFDHTTCAVAVMGSLSGPIMVRLKMCPMGSGFSQLMNAPPRLMFFSFGVDRSVGCFHRDRPVDVRSGVLA